MVNTMVSSGPKIMPTGPKRMPTWSQHEVNTMPKRMNRKKKLFQIKHQSTKHQSTKHQSLEKGVGGRGVALKSAAACLVQQAYAGVLEDTLV